MTIATLAIAAISAGVSYKQGNDSAKQQTAAVVRNDELQQMDAVRQQSQQAAQGAEEMNHAARGAQSDMAALDAIAGEYGGGNSFDRSRATIGIQSGEGLATIKSNATSGLNESAAGAYAARSRSIGQMKSIQRPSAALAALQIGGASVGAYDKYQTRTAPKGVK